MVGRFVKLIAVLASMLFLAACAGEPAVSPQDTSPTTRPDSTVSPLTFTLAYCRSDSLDPFRMSSRANRALCGLLYEGLTALDSTMHPQNALAESVQVNGTTVTAVLRQDAVFSNGDAITAEDVVTSFGAAQSAEYYKDMLRSVKSAEALDTRTVAFTFLENEPFAAACLSFPVVRVLADGIVLGSGPYVFDSTPQLTLNAHRASGTFQTIRLLDLRSDEEMATSLEMGNLTYFFSDLSGGELPRVASATAVVPMNYFVFLGVNSDRDAMAKSEVRRAISLALDRTAFVTGAFAGYAEAATAVFPPCFVAAEKEMTLLSSVADRTAAMQALAAAGYATLSADSVEGKPLSLSVLVNTDNAYRVPLSQFLKSQLEAVGITVTITELPYADYLVALKHGRYDLYIGEVRLTDNLDLSALLTTGGAAAYGLSSKNAAVKTYADFRTGSATLSAFSAEFAAQLPVIPLCWRSGMAAYNRALTDVTPISCNVYHDLVNWKLTNQKGV